MEEYSPHQQVGLIQIFILAILIGVRWNLRVVWIFISLMIKDVEHFLSASQLLSHSRCLSEKFFVLLCTPLFFFDLVIYFCIFCFGFLETRFLSSSYILNIRPLSDEELVNMFS